MITFMFDDSQRLNFSNNSNFNDKVSIANLSDGSLNLNFNRTLKNYIDVQLSDLFFASAVIL